MSKLFRVLSLNLLLTWVVLVIPFAFGFSTAQAASPLPASVSPHCEVSSQIATKDQHQCGAAYAYWQFQGNNPQFWDVDQDVWIDQKAPFTYWAQQFGFTGSSDGGYMGLQTNGNRFDGSVGEMAIFSLWNANGARGSSCDTFNGEGTGYSCRLSFNIQTGVIYRFRVWRLETDSDGQWWGAWIYSDATKTDYHIGDVRVPDATNHYTIDSVMNFTEYFGPAVPCDQVPQSSIELTQPAANYHGGNTGVYDYYSQYAGAAKLNCTASSATATDYGWTKGVRLVMGSVISYSLPLLANNAKTSLGQTTTFVTLQNLSSDTVANVKIQYFNPTDGTTATTDTLTIPAKGQQAILPSIPAGADYTGEISSDQSLNVVVSEALNGGGTAYNVSNLPAATLYSPLALNGQYGFTTQINVFNPSSTTTTGKIYFYDEQGNQSGNTQAFTLAAHARQTFNQAAVNSGLSSNHAYWAEIVADDSSASLTAQVTEFGPNNFVTTFNAMEPSQIQNTLYAPATFNGQFGFVTGMALANPNPISASLTISYYDASGKLLLAQPQTIPANGTIGVYQPALTNLDNTVSSATISSTQPLMMTVNEHGPGTISGTYVGLTNGSTKLAIPVMANGFAGFTTGATVFNTSTTSSATITFTYLDKNGNPVGQPQTKTLGPNASFLVYQGDVGQGLPGAGSGQPFFGTATLSSDQPLLVTTNALNTNSGLFYTYTEPSS